MRIIKINEEEILFDYRNASEIVNKAIRNSQNNTKVTGCCKHNDNIIVTIEETKDKSSLIYIFAPLPVKSDSELIATIRSRYDSGFSTITKFDIDDTSWGLFSQPSL